MHVASHVSIRFLFFFLTIFYFPLLVGYHIFIYVFLFVQWANSCLCSKQLFLATTTYKF